jgi:uncharacterized protein (TIGR02145 family)
MGLNSTAYFWEKNGFDLRILSDYTAELEFYTGHYWWYASARCIKNMAPSVETDTLASLTTTEAVTGGLVIHHGGSSVTARGVCWNTSGNPSITDDHTTDGTGMGAFTSILTNLTPNTTYYAKAYATNSEGTAYGDEIVFTTLSAGFNCGDILTDARDGKNYQTTLIGNQCWMAENLAYLPSVAPLMIGSDSIPFYYVHGYNGTSVNDAMNTTNYQTYGVLYNWSAAILGSQGGNMVPGTIQGICPEGWHMPGDEEWKILEGETDSQFGYPDNEWNGTDWRGFDAGLHLKASTGWSGASNPDTYGFGALPGGFRISWGGFLDLGTTGIFWSGTPSGSGDAWFRMIEGGYGKVYRMAYSRSSAMSIRCIRNAEVTSSLLLTPNILDVTCPGGSDGSASVVVTGGVSPYAYDWSGGETTHQISGVSAGSYTVTVTDGSGTTATESVTISEPDEVVIQSDVIHNQCFTTSSGAIDLTVTGGTPPYLYNWSNGATNEDLNNLINGIYEVTISDANNCLYYYSVEIIAQSSIEVSA